MAGRGQSISRRSPGGDAGLASRSGRPHRHLHEDHDVEQDTSSGRTRRCLLRSCPVFCETFSLQRNDIAWLCVISCRRRHPAVASKGNTGRQKGAGHQDSREQTSHPTSVPSTCPEQSLRSHWESASVESAERKKKVQSLSPVQLFPTPWTVAHQAPPSMGFSRQESWSGLPFPSPGEFCRGPGMWG